LKKEEPMNKSLAAALAGFSFLLGGCETFKDAYGITAREQQQKINYTRADAACIESANHHWLDNPYKDYANTYIRTLDGQEAGGAEDLCVTPGEHTLEIRVAKGYGEALAHLRVTFVAQQKYRLRATVSGPDATCFMYTIGTDDREDLVAQTVGHMEQGRPQMVVPVTTK
jgi:hypothetical protein